MFTMMGVLGFLNGFVLLPVLLSWVGPPPLPHVQERSNTIQPKEPASPTDLKNFLPEPQNGHPAPVAEDQPPNAQM
eukprot:c14523_g1_i1 orf=403-630(+)